MRHPGGCDRSLGYARGRRPPEAGRLVQERTPEAIAGALRALLADPPPRAAVRAYAERFAWGPTTAGQIRLFRSILDRAG